MRRPATMGDVASLAGVSSQTVSRVLNEPAVVRPETRDRVLAAIDNLGYRRNTAARALVTRRSQTIGVVSLATRLYGPTSVVHGIEQAARAAGYYVSIASQTSVDRLTLGAALDRLAEHGVEGVVVVGPQRHAQAALAELAEDVPVVVVDGYDDGAAPRVSVDHEEGARLATEHLLDQGVRTVHHVAGPAGWLETDERVRGWQRALEAAGAEAPEPLRGDWSCGSGYDAGRRLAADPDVEAVFVANDQMAIGLLCALAEAGRPAPDHVLVAGFDDVPEAAYVRPPLTTVRQDFTTLGRRSIDLLIAQLEDRPSAPRSLAVPAELVVRDSSTGTRHATHKPTREPRKGPWRSR